ncbi:MAG: fibronectin type III domain-containing protein, partial [Saprospiraceae bacterium]
NPGTNYQWRVRANCGYGYYSYWTPGMPFTTTGTFACNAPDWLYTAYVTQTSASLDWSNVVGALSYTVQLREVGGNWYDYPGCPWYNSWLSIGGLEPGTTYEWRVKSNCANGEMSEWSYSVTFTTLGNVCHTPYQTWTTNITDHSATFNWSPVSGAESYSVQIRDQWGSWHYIPGSPFYGTWATVNNLSPGTTYEWRVRANCDYGNYSYWTPGLHFTTLGSYSCHAPEDLFTTNITQTSATWDWSPVSGAVSYSVQWRYAGGTWYNLPGGPWYNTWLNVGGLQPGTEYEWRVRANCSYGNYSDWSYPEFFVTLGYSCYAPENLYESNITNDGATLHWDDVYGADSYSVQIREPWGSWYYIPGSPFNSNWAEVNGLDPNTTYEWRVRANCGYGNYSSWCYPESFTTSGYNNNDNDNCSEATWLTVNNTCYYVSGSSIGSTASYPAPQGNCPHSGYKDVWFKFNMPDNYNPVATIRTSAGSLTDAVMELYVGNSCGYMAFLGCEDDNNNGNGSDMPVMTVMGGQGLTIFVRIWGHYGNTGTFNICVFDDNSNNFADGDEEHQVITIPENHAQVDHVSDGEMVIDGQDAGELTLAPNPVNDILNVKYGQTTESIVSTLVLTDMSGKILVRKDYESKDVIEFHEQLNVSDLAPGIYVVQLRTSNGVVSERVSVVD